VRILIAEDDPISRRVLESSLTNWGYEVVTTDNGRDALEHLSGTTAPPLAILDWMMPELDGPTVCHRLRQESKGRMTYVIMLTARSRKEDVAAGLTAGADDYLVKPFDRNELQARIQVGERILRLQAELTARVQELELALTRVKLLSGLLPICCYCKKIRNDQNYWQQVETYVKDHSEAEFSHGICPDCYEKMVMPQLKELTERRAQR
jgi:DNA-binding response OmpR family regulator